MVRKKICRSPRCRVEAANTAIQRLFMACKEGFKGSGTIPAPPDVHRLQFLLGGVTSLVLEIWSWGSWGYNSLGFLFQWFYCVKKMPVSNLSTRNSYGSCKPQDAVTDEFPAGMRVLVVDDDTT